MPWSRGKAYSQDLRERVFALVRIPMKSATHSNAKPATDSDLKPVSVPI